MKVYAIYAGPKGFTADQMAYLVGLHQQIDTKFGMTIYTDTRGNGGPHVRLYDADLAEQVAERLRQLGVTHAAPIPVY